MNQVSHHSIPSIQIGMLRDAAKEKGNSGEEMINGDIRVEERERGISKDILVDGNTVDGREHLFP